MNTRLLPIGMASTLLLAGTATQASHMDEYAREPSINGGVSATGRLASQAEQDRYFAEQLALELEPCINGGVSASGLSARQAERNAGTDRLAGN